MNFWQGCQIISSRGSDTFGITAEGCADAEKLKAEAAEKTYAVDAEGQHAINESRNILNAEQIAMQIRMALIEQLPQIIRESVKPMEQIDGIKIIQVDGLNGGSSGAGEAATNNSNGGSLADQLVNSALKYRSQAPLVDSLLSDIGLDVGDINGMSRMLHNKPETESKRGVDS